jgi:hypothetical protein
MVHGKRHPINSAASQKFRGFGRWPQQMVPGQSGLNHGQSFFPDFANKNE